MPSKSAVDVVRSKRDHKNLEFASVLLSIRGLPRLTVAKIQAIGAWNHRHTLQLYECKRSQIKSVMVGNHAFPFKLERISSKTQQSSIVTATPPSIQITANQSHPDTEQAKGVSQTSHVHDTKSEEKPGRAPSLTLAPLRQRRRGLDDLLVVQLPLIHLLELLGRGPQLLAQLPGC